MEGGKNESDPSAEQIKNPEIQLCGEETEYFHTLKTLRKENKEFKIIHN